jgi:molybdate transport system substrate-binding protein
VARGEAPLGIVYRSDAAAEPAVRVVAALPADSHAEIVYPFALTASSDNPAAAAFLDHLGSPAALAAFAAQGFRVLP